MKFFGFFLVVLHCFLPFSVNAQQKRTSSAQQTITMTLKKVSIVDVNNISTSTNQSSDPLIQDGIQSHDKWILQKSISDSSLVNTTNFLSTDLKTDELDINHSPVLISTISPM